MALLVLKQLVIMLCIVSVSFFFARKIKPGKTEQQFLSKILLYLVAPCLLLHILDAPYDGEKIKQFIVIALVSAVMHVLLSRVFLHDRKRRKERRLTVSTASPSCLRIAVISVFRSYTECSAMKAFFISRDLSPYSISLCGRTEVSKCPAKSNSKKYCSIRA